MMGGVVGEHSGDGEQTTRRSTMLLVEMTTTARRGELTGGAPVAWDVRLASVTVYMSAYVIITLAANNGNPVFHED
ncbi:hypothetical protein J6590_091331 [Homalodisca vitripennis]|nr:hypothetical protein J6590_091331 [Homalodisca vitripennis]